MIRVHPRARRSEDRAGDPLDGLVNMFDIGIVLSLGFLIAALSSLRLTDTVTKDGLKRDTPVTVDRDSAVRPVPVDRAKVIGRGTQIGQVYRLEDGRLVYVVPRASATPSPSPTP